MNTAPCDVGYGKPPTGSRFVKGQSGNPGGRPRGGATIKEMGAVAADAVRATPGSRTFP